MRSRTCVGCRTTRPTTELVRVAAAKDGTIGFGPQDPGRGAWLCAGSAGCFDRAVTRGGLARALRRSLVIDEVHTIRARLFR